jgi:hypothetical protein
LYRYAGSAVLQNAGLVKKQSPNPNNPVSAGIEGVACTNSGEWLVADGTLSMQNSTYTQTDGQLTVYGTLSCNNTLQIAGGMVRGLGTINASVNNTGGIVHPGDETRRGALTIWNGNYSQGADAELRLTITGLQPNEFDRLVVARASGSGADVGRVFLDGKLKAIFESYVPAENDAFNILSYRLRDGQFAELEVEGLACGVAELEYLANAARLRVVQTGNREEPGVGFTAGPANGSRVCSLPVVFRWRGCDNDTPVENLQYRYRVDGGAWSAWSSQKRRFRWKALADGVHVFEVQARDASGNRVADCAARVCAGHDAACAAECARRERCRLHRCYHSLGDGRACDGAGAVSGGRRERLDRDAAQSHFGACARGAPDRVAGGDRLRVSGGVRGCVRALVGLPDSGLQHGARHDAADRERD